MSLRRFLGPFAALSLVFSATAMVGCSSAGTEDGAQTGSAQSAARPPQFVLLAFDGSLNNEFWGVSREAAKKYGVKFTYFMNGTYFLPDARKKEYVGPKHQPGQSDIGFGGLEENIKIRLEHVAGAAAEGHEIASHANGHFDGSSWSEEDWTNEFDQFEPLIGGAAKEAGVDLGTLLKKVKGFRAPLLGHSPGLYKTLEKKGFRYDTSRSSATDFWPKKFDGTNVWNFPLAEVRIAGLSKSTLSMDYNFYVADTKGSPGNPEDYAMYEQRMYETYMNYFESNYFGNRAPVHIGHHFSRWNGGAYWKAMQRFAESVCSQEEVKCVTYSELVDYMDKNAANRDSFQKTDFPKAVRPPGAAVSPVTPISREGLVTETSAAHSHEEE